MLKLRLVRRSYSLCRDYERSHARSFYRNARQLYGPCRRTRFRSQAKTCLSIALKDTWQPAWEEQHFGFFSWRAAQIRDYLIQQDKVSEERVIAVLARIDNLANEDTVPTNLILAGS